MTADYHQGLTSQPNELSQFTLKVDGRIPAWVRGTLVRNGPGQFEVGSTSIAHWFDGLAMLHAFEIADGGVRYSNRFLRSNAWAHNNANGRINYRGFAQDPCRSLFKRVMTMFDTKDTGNNAVVNITQLGNAFVAMTESPMTVQFDPRTLETVGVMDYHDDVNATLATAHPHYDPARQMGINLMTEFGLKTKYQIYGVTDTQRHKLGEVISPDVSYMHSFGLTPRYAVIAQFSLRLSSPARMLLSGRPFIENFHYSPTTDAVFTVLDLDTGAVVAHVPADAFFSFHHINAYEDGESLVVDLVAYDNADLIQQVYMHRLRQDTPVQLGEFRRYRVPLTGGRAAYEVLSDALIELPRINYRRNGQPYRYVYASATPRHAPRFMDQLAKIDTHLRKTLLWQEANCYPGEPVFLSSPHSETEDDGVLLTVVLDSRTGTSFLLVLDAATFTEVARAHVPQHIPFGFHGQFFGGVL